VDDDTERCIETVAEAYPDADPRLVGTKRSWADGGPDRATPHA
jgi:hypothetical protein